MESYMDSSLDLLGKNHSAMVRFMLRHGDADILLMLEKTVPPVSLAPISIFATALSKFNNEAQTQQIKIASWVPQPTAAQLWNCKWDYKWNSE